MLGIVGGLSVLGTTGIVEPMSEKALIDTIAVDIRMHRAQNEDILLMAPGNYGLDFLKNTYHYDLDKSVKCSNFIGLTIDMAVEEGFRRLLLAGHIGKLIKVAGGIMNTHSKEGDARMGAAGRRSDSSRRKHGHPAGHSELPCDGGGAGHHSGGIAGAASEEHGIGDGPDSVLSEEAGRRGTSGGVHTVLQ